VVRKDEALAIFRTIIGPVQALLFFVSGELLDDKTLKLTLGVTVGALSIVGGVFALLAKNRAMYFCGLALRQDHPEYVVQGLLRGRVFARNVRAIEVLVDRDAVTSGAAAAGEPWQHYDLGHGWCTYSFFEQCPHRMACARCDFYTPKDSTKAQLLEASGNLQRMLASIPLTDEERAVVDDGHTAVAALLDRLADVPTAAGPTPRELGTPAIATLLPIVQIRTGKPRT
jgi:hypothetical protein